MMENQPHFEAPAAYVVFKRWDRLDPSDSPELVIFFAPPDVPAGLFTVSGFDRSEADMVIALAAGHQVADNDLGAAPRRAATVRLPDIRVTLLVGTRSWPQLK